ncbi:hypothetical protein BJF96_g10410 [Verticillium dahliae]|uniref:SHSP domain-containing protein n=1 Tax=Verticillium dahliae TaxID=27337 RepID=A0AA44W8X9_VERDA|nr:hypothetical protein BJF96_g10410 [Verticillium dahliae]PNH56479.1 hypothetical protein VD0003_g1216 [Verticillium dahliae]
MSWNNNGHPFNSYPGNWDNHPFFNAMPGFGIDHADQSNSNDQGPHPWAQNIQSMLNAFPFGPGPGGPRRGFGHGGPGGRGGWRGRRGRHDHHRGGPPPPPPPHDGAPATDPVADPDTSVPEPDHHPRSPPAAPHHGRHSHDHSPPPAPGAGGHGPTPHTQHPRGPPPPYANHPFAQLLSSLLPDLTATASTTARRQACEDEDEAPFAPPLDLFSTPQAYTLHVALPGAKKQDIGVDWDADRSTLRIAGVLHRPADSQLLEALLPSHAERRVGFFERVVALPPAGHEQPRREQRVFVDGEAEAEESETEEGREEIDGAGIMAKMEDGILIVTVPKVERGWTEVRKVDIE